MMDHVSRKGCTFKDARFPGVFTDRPLKTPRLPQIRIADGKRAHLSLRIPVLDYTIMVMKSQHRHCEITSDQSVSPPSRCSPSPSNGGHIL